MAEDKVKTESYNNLGGINSKVSPYLTGPQEFLDLQNFDFTRPGSLTKSPGSSTLVVTLSPAFTLGPISSIFEFTPSSNFVGVSSFSITAFTMDRYLFYKSPPSTGAANISGYYSNSGSLILKSIWSGLSFVDNLFMSNGQNFIKWDGFNSSYNVSLPYGGMTTLTTSLTTAKFGATAFLTGSGGMSGIFIVGYGYRNKRSYFGPAGPINGITVVVDGTNFDSIVFSGMGTVPDVPGGSTSTKYGEDKFVIYCTLPGLEHQFRATIIPIQATFVLDNGAAGAGHISPIPNPTYIHFTLAPKYLEIFNNSLMMSGFSAFPSTVWFSDVGEPEGMDPTFNFPVRTNDGDRVYGQKSYNGGCIFFKERSLHRLSGDSPDNYILQEVTDQYGCISHRAAVVWQEHLWFLDKKGVCEYNGANTFIVSNKVEPIFQSMNVDAARDQAIAIHNRLRNEIWFSIPIEGATLNNCTVVYDYVAQGWSTFRGFNPFALAMIKHSFTDQRAMYGDYTGSILYFDPALTSHKGVAFTCMIGSRFFGDQGRSIQTQFRRLFLDTDPVTGGASAITVNFFQDYGSSIILSRQMGQQTFQSRIDFGISAKSLAFKMYHTSATLSIRVNGWTTEGRTQRRV